MILQLSVSEKISGYHQPALTSAEFPIQLGFVFIQIVDQTGHRSIDGNTVCRAIHTVEHRGFHLHQTNAAQGYRKLIAFLQLCVGGMLPQLHLCTQCAAVAGAIEPVRNGQQTVFIQGSSLQQGIVKLPIGGALYHAHIIGCTTCIRAKDQHIVSGNQRKLKTLTCRIGLDVAFAPHQRQLHGPLLYAA